MPKLAPPPTVAPETWSALLAAAADFAVAEPWQHMYDSDAVGLLDPVTGEMRIGTVLGHAGEVFAAIIYRRAGLRWILGVLEEAPEPEDFNIIEGMDCLKVEFVPKRELEKADRAVLKATAFKPTGRGVRWPQFRSSEPGWHPWHINQTEAEQLLADLPRFIAFCQLFKEHPDLFDDRPATETPFLPVVFPERPLTLSDLDWRPLLPPPATPPNGFQPDAGQWQQLQTLKRQPGLTCEFDSRFLPGGSFIENGRSCFGRLSLLVEQSRGLVIGMAVSSGAVSVGEAVGRSLVDALLQSGQLPEKIFLSGARLQPALQSLCDELRIELCLVSSMPALEEAVEALSQHMLAAGGPRG